MGNCLVAQSGGPTAVINASLAGVIRANQLNPAYDRVFGGIHGIEGVLEDKLYDLTELSGREVELLRKEYDILHYFMSRPNHTVDKTALAEGVWGDHIDQADNFDFVYAQMKNLRRKLHDAGADIEIRAVYGFGYKLIRP